MKKQFLEFLKENRITPTNIAALVEEEHPRHTSESVYTSCKIWVESKDGVFMFYKCHDKWGSPIGGVSKTETKQDDQFFNSLSMVELNSSFHDTDMSLEELAEEIYMEDRVYEEFNIDLNQVTKNDIDRAIELLDTLNKYKKEES